MSDISITVGSVLKGTNAKTRHGTAGATITAGQPVYEDSTDGFRFKPADANASAATSNVVGIALHGASDEHPLEIVTEDDDFTPGGTLSLSAAADDGVYVLSANAGGIAPIGDLAAGHYPVILGVAKSTTKMVLKIVRAGVVLTA